MNDTERNYQIYVIDGGYLWVEYESCLHNQQILYRAIAYRADQNVSSCQNSRDNGFNKRARLYTSDWSDTKTQCLEQIGHQNPQWIGQLVPDNPVQEFVTPVVVPTQKSLRGVQASGGTTGGVLFTCETKKRPNSTPGREEHETEVNVSAVGCLSKL